MANTRPESRDPANAGVSLGSAGPPYSPNSGTAHQRSGPAASIRRETTGVRGRPDRRRSSRVLTDSQTGENDRPRMRAMRVRARRLEDARARGKPEPDAYSRRALLLLSSVSARDTGLAALRWQPESPLDARAAPGGRLFPWPLTC
jgi:hypothetical protein